MQVLKGLIDRTTTYRLMLYYLLALFAAALGLSTAGIVPYAPLDLIWSFALLMAFAWGANTALARLFGAVTNRESIFITAFILAFLVSPVPMFDLKGSALLAFIAIIAAASKYVLAFQRKHIFNPAALAVAVSAFALNVPATWWVAGNSWLLPVLLIGGIVVVYKLRKFDLLGAFALAVLLTILVIAPNPFSALTATLAYSAIFFFAFVMLTEPSTMPPTRPTRLIYGVLIGTLFIVAPSLGPVSLTPELALLVGNLFAFLVGPTGRYRLSLVLRRPLASGIYEYLFRSDRPVLFSPGQYLEWTLPNVPHDNRGNRRYFTIASAPEDEILALGVRFYEKPSAFKRTLNALPAGAVATAAAPAGDFTLPRDTGRKLAFLAGGIGVTPFVSMARHMNKTGEKRDAILLYCAKSDDEVAYREVFSEAIQHGLRAQYLISQTVDADRIKREVPDYIERLFYISGPPGFVDAMKSHLRSLGISRFAIRTDFFPGLAQ